MGSLLDDDGSYRALRQARLSFPARTFFFLKPTIMLVLGLLVKCDGIGLVCFVSWLVCFVRLLVPN